MRATRFPVTSIRVVLGAMTTCACAAVLLWPSKASAHIRDVAVSSQGERVRIRVDLGAVIAGAQAAPSENGVRVRLAGVAADARTWSFAPDGLVSGLEMRAGEGGAELMLATRTSVLATRAHAHGRALIIDALMAAPVSARTGPSPLYKDDGTPASNRATSRTRASQTRPATAATLTAARGDAQAPSQQKAPRPSSSTPAKRPARQSLGAAAPLVGLLNAGAEADACETAKSTVADDPWNLTVLARHGACLVEDGRPDEAEEVYARLLTFTPEDGEANLGLGLVRVLQGRADEAREHFERAVNGSRSDAEAARARAFLDFLDQG